MGKFLDCQCQEIEICMDKFTKHKTQFDFGFWFGAAFNDGDYDDSFMQGHINTSFSYEQCVYLLIFDVIACAILLGCVNATICGDSLYHSQDLLWPISATFVLSRLNTHAHSCLYNNHHELISAQLLLRFLCIFFFSSCRLANIHKIHKKRNNLGIEIQMQISTSWF